MTRVGHSCMAPFRQVDLVCDVCTQKSSGPNWDHVVRLADGRTICKPCAEDLAKSEATASLA